MAGLSLPSYPGHGTTGWDATWQNILNTLNSGKADDSAVMHLTGSETVAGVKTFSSAPVVPAGSFPESAVTNLTSDLASKATDSAVVHLSGAETIAGVKTFSSAPVVPSNSFPESAITNLTSDLAAKAVDANVVHNSGAETIAGVKTFSSAPVVPAASFPESAVTNLTSDLAAKATDSAVVHNTGAETIAGAKTFSTAPVVPSNSFPESAITNLTTDLAAKATDTSVVHLAGTETIAGAKTFSTAPVVPSNSFPESAVTNLTTDLASKYVKPGTGIPLGDLSSSVQSAISSGGAQPKAWAFDAVGTRNITRFNVARQWAVTNNVKLVLGEVGIPGSTETSPVLYDALYEPAFRGLLETAKAAGVPFWGWTAAEWSIGLRSYQSTSGTSGDLTTRTSVGAILEDYFPYSTLNGVNVSGAEFGQSPTAALSPNPGASGTQYQYPSANSIAYLAGRGIKTIRLPVVWERFQATPGATLIAAEVARLKAVLDVAAVNNMTVVIDLHNYGAYTGANGTRVTLGDSAPTNSNSITTMQAAFVNFWTQIGTTFGTHAGLSGYGLMNEPHDVTGGYSTWQAASQAAAVALRGISGTDTTKKIFVSLYNYATPDNVSSINGNTAWLYTYFNGVPLNQDPNVYFEVHMYLDSDGSGNYTTSHATALTNATNAGYVSGILASTVNQAAVTSVAKRTGDITLNPIDVNLGNVNNTSDANKPVSTATQTALNGKANTLTAQNVTTSPGAGVAGNYYLINATSPQTVTLPTSTPGQEIGIMNISTNPTVNTVTISGTINGTSGAGIMLVIPNEGKILVADGSGGWAVESSNYGRSGLDSRYMRGMTSRVAIVATTTANAANFTAAPQTMYAVDATNNPVTVTLPTTNIASDLLYVVKTDTSSNLVTYTGTVNGTASFSGSVRTQNQGKLFQGDGTGNWNIIGGDVSVSALDLRYAALGSTAVYSSTSSTSNQFTTGSKNYTVGTGLAWTAGQPILFTQTGVPANNLIGTVTSYNSSTGAMVVNITAAAGTSTATSNWTLNLTGQQGPAPTANSSITMLYAATITPNAQAGNVQYCNLTGNVTVAAPINPTIYQTIEFIFYNSSASAVTASFASGAGGFVFGNTSPAANFTSIAPGSYTRVFAQFNSTANLWAVAGYSQGTSA